MVVRVMLEIKIPAKVLPFRRCLMEFIRRGLFSLTKISVGKRGYPRKIIWVLWTTVREVATRVISRAQMLVYDVLVDSIIKSFE